MLELKDILTVLISLGGLLFAVYSFRRLRQIETAAENTEWSKAQLADSQLFRQELRAEVAGLKLELKETNVKLDAAEFEILKLNREVAQLQYQKMIVEKEKSEDGKKFEEKISRLQMRVTQLEKVLTDNGIPFEHI